MLLQIIVKMMKGTKVLCKKKKHYVTFKLRELQKKSMCWESWLQRAKPCDSSVLGESTMQVRT